MTHKVRTAFAETGIGALEAEVIRIGADGDHRRLIDIASEIGVNHVIVVSMIADARATRDSLAEIADYAAGTGIRPVLEFGGFSGIATLEEALAIIAASGADVGILPDLLHLSRSGGRPADLHMVPQSMIAFAQICDAGPPLEDMGAEALLWEARYARCDLGEGTLPVAEYIAALPPGIVLSNEVRSLELERRLPDPFERAAALAKTMRRWIEKETMDAG